MKPGDLVFIQAGYDDYLRQIGVVLGRCACTDYDSGSVDDRCIDVMCEDGVWTVGIDELEVVSAAR